MSFVVLLTSSLCINSVAEGIHSVIHFPRLLFEPQGCRGGVGYFRGTVYLSYLLLPNLLGDTLSDKEDGMKKTRGGF
jgi:hypothetical protein